MPPAPNYGEPFHWWGHRWDTPTPLGVAELLRNETVDASSGALVWAGLERRWSIAVIGGPAGAGKSTLLWGLLDLLPPGMQRIYLRGNFETFTFLRDEAYDASSSILLANELSPHLPVYLWGTTLTRLLGEAAGGAQIAATAHAGSVAEFVSLLAGSPMRIPMRRIGKFDLVAVVKQAPETKSGRCLAELWRLRSTRSGIDMRQIYDRTMNDISPEAPHNPITETSLPARELSERATILAGVSRGSVPDLPQYRVDCR